MKFLIQVIVLVQVIYVLALPAANLPGAKISTSAISSPSPVHSLKLATGSTDLTATDQPVVSDSYESHAQTAVYTLQNWYDQSSGLWTGTGWWNSANCLTVLADFAIAAPDAYQGIQSVFNNTFLNAPNINLAEAKIRDENALISTVAAEAAASPEGFLNGYYDDEGWWAMGWIRTFDLTGNPEYLQAAASIFEDMKDGFNAPCGGMWWDKSHTGQVAISNELFLDVSASLANRASYLNDNIKTKPYYLEWAQKEWSFFNSSGMINDDHNINDGLEATTCSNNGATVWSYNQGVILGGLVELNIAAPDPTLLPLAGQIASAAISKLSDSNGVLHEACEPNCGSDGTQFKGIFMRNLAILNNAAPNPDYVTFIQKNAQSVWVNDRNGANQLSVDWSGPYVDPGNASTQSSAMDALVAAIKCS